MGTVAKFAMAYKGTKFPEAVETGIGIHMPESKFSDAGRVDKLAARGDMKQPRTGGGVRAPVVIAQLADAHIGFWQECVDQRGFAHPRLPHKHTGKVR